MTLVSADDRPRPRVGPKVFADVPTAAELADARKGSRTMGVVVFVLLGALVACVAFLVYRMSTPTPAVSELKTANEQLVDRQKQLDTAQRSLRALAGYQNIAEYERRAAELKSQIGTLLTERSNQNIQARITPRTAWRPYEQEAVWNQADVELRLRQQVTELEALHQRILDLPPLVVTRAPVDERRRDPAP